MGTTLVDVELAPQGIDLPGFLASLEKSLIEQALTRSNGIKAQAALLLKINRTTLVEKMRKYGMPLLPPSKPTRGRAA